MRPRGLPAVALESANRNNGAHHSAPPGYYYLAASVMRFGATCISICLLRIPGQCEAGILNLDDMCVLYSTPVSRSKGISAGLIGLTARYFKL